MRGDGGNAAGKSNMAPRHSNNSQGVLFRDLRSGKTGIRGLDNETHFRVSRI